MHRELYRRPHAVTELAPRRNLQDPATEEQLPDNCASRGILSRSFQEAAEEAARVLARKLATMGRALPDHLLALASTTSTYVPLEKTAEQIRRVALEGDVPRLDRLWASLRVRYPASDNLAQCLIHPELYSRNPVLILAAEKKLVDVVAWLLDQGVEEGGMSKVGCARSADRC